MPSIDDYTFRADGEGPPPPEDRTRSVLFIVLAGSSNVGGVRSGGGGASTLTSDDAEALGNRMAIGPWWATARLARRRCRTW